MFETLVSIYAAKFPNVFEPDSCDCSDYFCCVSAVAQKNPSHIKKMCTDYLPVDCGYDSHPDYEHWKILSF